MGRYSAFISWKRLSVVSIAVFFFSSVQAELIFTAPPRENLEKGETLYKPIAEKLSELLGEPVVYEQPRGWADYAQKMRNDEYDVVFDGPHFTAWRIKRLKHTPVAVLPGHLRFLLVGNKRDENINQPRDLVGSHICSLNSPFLGTDLIYEMYNNPVLQPLIFTIRGGMKAVYKSFKQGKCKAAIMRDAAFNRLPDTDKATLKIIAATQSLPNQTVTISHRLKKHSQKIRQFMVSDEGAMAADKLLARYSKRKQQFLKPNSKKYKNAEELLEGVVWGW